MGFVARVWKDPVWSKIISTVIGAAGVAIWARIQGFLTVTTMQHATAVVWNFLTDDYNKPRWIIIFGNVLFAAGGALLMWYRMNNKVDVLLAHLEKLQRASEAVRPTSGPYLTDVIFGFRWRWKIAEKSGEAYGLRMYCPKCDYELEADAFQYRYGDTMYCECDSCIYSADIPTEDPAIFQNRVKLEVERRIRTGEGSQASQQG